MQRGIVIDMHIFSVRESIRFGWETFKKRPWFFIFTFLVISILTSNYSYNVGEGEIHFHAGLITLMVLSGVLGAVVQTLVGMGKINLCLKAHDDANTVSWADLWHPHPFWRYLLTMFAYIAIVIAGLILLIVPGVVWSLTYAFAPYLVIDRGLGVREALRESARMTYGHRWHLLRLALALALVNVVGFLCLIVGLLVSVPVSTLAFVRVYRLLSSPVPVHG